MFTDPLGDCTSQLAGLSAKNGQHIPKLQRIQALPSTAKHCQALKPFIHHVDSIGSVLLSLGVRFQAQDIGLSRTLQVLRQVRAGGKASVETWTFDPKPVRNLSPKGPGRPEWSRMAIGKASCGLRPSNQDHNSLNHSIYI